MNDPVMSSDPDSHCGHELRRLLGGPVLDAFEAPEVTDLHVNPHIERLGDETAAPAGPEFRRAIDEIGLLFDAAFPDLAVEHALDLLFTTNPTPGRVGPAERQTLYERRTVR